MSNTSAFLINRQQLFTCLGLTYSSCELPSQILCFDPHLVLMNKTGPGNTSFMYEPQGKFHSSWIMQTSKLTEAYKYLLVCVYFFQGFFFSLSFPFYFLSTSVVDFPCLKSKDKTFSLNSFDWPRIPKCSKNRNRYSGNAIGFNF